MVNIIDNIYTTEGIILYFFFIALTCPLGVERKQLPAIFRIWQKENISAKATTFTAPNTNKNVNIHEKTLPIIEQDNHPIRRCLYVNYPQSVYSFFPPLKILP